MNFSLGVVMTEPTKVSKYQKYNQRGWEQRKKKKMDVNVEISGCLVKQSPGVVILLTTAAVDPIIEI